MRAIKLQLTWQHKSKIICIHVDTEHLRKRSDDTQLFGIYSFRSVITNVIEIILHGVTVHLYNVHISLKVVAKGLLGGYQQWLWKKEQVVQEEALRESRPAPTLVLCRPSAFDSCRQTNWLLVAGSRQCCL